MRNAMNEYDQVFDLLRNAGIEVDTDGEQTIESIAELEKSIGFPLPASYREFVRKFGFAGPEHNPYLGIVENQPLKEVGVSAYHQTNLLRQDWNLPKHLLVVHYDCDLRLATCIDLSSQEEKVVLVEKTEGDLDITMEGNEFKAAFIRHMQDIVSANTE